MPSPFHILYPSHWLQCTHHKSSHTLNFCLCVHHQSVDGTLHPSYFFHCYYLWCSLAYLLLYYLRYYKANSLTEWYALIQSLNSDVKLRNVYLIFSPLSGTQIFNPRNFWRCKCIVHNCELDVSWNCLGSFRMIGGHPKSTVRGLVFSTTDLRGIQWGWRSSGWQWFSLSCLLLMSL